MRRQDAEIGHGVAAAFTAMGGTCGGHFLFVRIELYEV